MRRPRAAIVPGLRSGPANCKAIALGVESPQTPAFQRLMLANPLEADRNIEPTRLRCSCQERCVC